MSTPLEMVIDGNSHICEPELVWTECTQAKYREQVLQIRIVDGKSHLYIEGHMRRVADGASRCTTNAVALAPR